MKNKSYNDILDDMALNIEKIDDNFILMKEQLTEFAEGDKIKINFKGCHVAICPNGGLIAICKKKGFLDISKGTKINNNIIIMNQNGKRKLYIPIDWNYKYKWVVNFEFNEKEQLYAICNDGSIFKMDILNLKAENKVSCEIFKNEEIEKCKLYKNGFIALTVDGNIYQIENIKNPTAELIIPMKSLLDFSNNIEYIIIPEDKSRSRQLELLITNDKGNGIIQVVKSEDGKFGIMPLNNDSNKMAYKNINIIKNDKIETLIIEEKEYEKDKENNMGKIIAMAMSPSNKKIALYNNKGHIIIFDSGLNYLDKTLIEIKGDFSENELNELKEIISFKDNYQFLFCGEDSIALSGQRFIIILNLNSSNLYIYKIIEGYEKEAMQGLFFSKCISEFDGLRYMTKEGVFLISNIHKELYDLCDTFSNSNNKKLLKCYSNSLNQVTNNEMSLKELKNVLADTINNLLIAASNIFWICNDNNNDDNFDIYNNAKKELQLFILEAAQYGKSFVRSDIFNFEKFLQYCKDIRIVNNLRNHLTRPKFITFKEYKNMEFYSLVNKVMRNINFGMAYELCHFLDYDDTIVFKKYCSYYIKKEKNNYNISDELKLFELLQTKLKKCKKIPYLDLAKKAFKYKKTTLGLKFLEHEKLKIAKIPQYIELKEWDTALKLAENICNSDIILTTLDKLYKLEGINKYLSVISSHEKIKYEAIKYLSLNNIDEIESYLKIENNPEELFFYYLEQYFQRNDISERKKLISNARKTQKLITNSINPNFEHKFYKNYLDNLEQNLIIKLDIMKMESEKQIIKNSSNVSFDISIYDTYKMEVIANKFNNVETQNKKFNFSHEGLNIMRFITYGELGKLNEIDSLIKKNNNKIKNLNVTYLNLSEIFFKYNGYKRAEENIKLINDTFYLGYKVDMLKFMDKYETALEIIISDKNNINQENLLNDILNRKPELKEKADELLKNSK